MTTASGEVVQLGARERWRGIAAAIACISVVGLAISLSTPLLSLLMEARGISGTWIGLNTAAGGVASLLIAPVVTPMVRRVGTTGLIYLALLASLVSFALFPVAPFWAWFPLRFVLGGALTVLFVVSEFWINSVAPEGRRGFVMGIYATVLSLGFAAGPAVLALFGSDSVIAFAVPIAAFALAAVPVAWGRSIAPRVIGAATRPMPRLLLVAPAATLAAFCFGAVEQTMFAFLPLYGLQSGLAEASAALLVTMAGLGNLLFAVPIGFVADRLNRNFLLTVCGCAGIAGAALLPWVVGSPWLAYAVMFAWGGMTGGLYTVGLTHLGARFSGADLATANALFVTLYALGMLVGPAAAGVAMDLSVHGLPAVFAGLLALYSAVAGWRWLARR